MTGDLRFVPNAFSVSWLFDARESEQVHFECTRFVLRSSRQRSHWETGRPFFLISYNGRSVWEQEEERWPLMQDSLYRRDGRRKVEGV